MLSKCREVGVTLTSSDFCLIQTCFQMYLPLYRKLLLHYILGDEYIKSLIAHPELVDLLALSNDDKVTY